MYMRKVLFLAVALLAATTTTASAGVIVQLEFTGKGALGQSLLGVKAHYNGGTYGGWAGQLNVNISTSNPFGFDGNQTVYCTELNEHANGNFRGYELDTINNLDIPSTAPPMGLSQKMALERMFSLVGEVDTNIEAAGFQIAVWEISQDVDFGNLTGPNSGNFYLTLTNNSYLNKYNAILDSANYFLDNLGSQGRVSVLGMVNNGSQDFVDASTLSQIPINSDVPEPATFAIFGVIGLLACGRRRSRKP